MKSTSQMAIVALLATALTACKKDVETPPSSPITPPTTAISAHFTFLVGESAFDPAQTFTDTQGRAVRVTKLKFYAHGIHFTDDQGADAGHVDRVILVDAAQGQAHIELGSLSPGHVHELHLALGLDSLSSYGHPDQATAPAPLNDADMTWAWNVAMGRMFVKLEGFVDLNGNNQLDAEETEFQYHGIGANMAPVHWHGHVHTDLNAGSAHMFHLQMDMAELVGGLALDGMYHDDGEQVQALMQALGSALHTH